jgi:hypothetical protein
MGVGVGGGALDWNDWILFYLIVEEATALESWRVMRTGGRARRRDGCARGAILSSVVVVAGSVMSPPPQPPPRERWHVGSSARWVIIKMIVVKNNETTTTTTRGNNVCECNAKRRSGTPGRPGIWGGEATPSSNRTAELRAAKARAWFCELAPVPSPQFDSFNGDGLLVKLPLGLGL